MLDMCLIKEDAVEKRQYQFDDAMAIVDAGKSGKNCSLVYPTGTGKTFTAFLVAGQYLKDARVLFLAHTNALCEQHCRDAGQIFSLANDEIAVLTGKASAKKRLLICSRARFIVATPQTVVSEVEKGHLDMAAFGLVVFDEMHMACKKYDYVKIAKWCNERNIRSLGLTASVGDSERIESLEKNYQIGWWVYRSSEDEEMLKFVFPKNERKVIIGYTEELKSLLFYLRCKLAQVHNRFAETGLIEKIPIGVDYDSRIAFYRTTELNSLYHRLQKWVAKQKETNPDARAHRYFVLFGAYYRLMHLLNLIVTENYRVAMNYVFEIRDQLVNIEKDPESPPHYRYNAAAEIWNDRDFQRVNFILNGAVLYGPAHPKQEKFRQIVGEHVRFGDKILVFSNFKETLDYLKADLVSRGITAEVVAGIQYMKVAEQRDIIDRFKSGEFSVLFATTVVEAGIHVPHIDVVINYSMPLTGIAQIQRGGRAGRTTVGMICYLIMDNSSDSSLYFAARSDNKAMDQELRYRLAVQARGETFSGIGKQGELFGEDIKADYLEKRRFKSKAIKFPEKKVQLDLFEGGEE